MDDACDGGGIAVVPRAVVPEPVELVVPGLRQEHAQGPDGCGRNAGLLVPLSSRTGSVTDANVLM